jgi:hypothetical protein
MNPKNIPNEYERLNFPGLELDQASIDDAYDEAIEHTTHFLSNLFGRVAVRGASAELPNGLSRILARFAEQIASEISSKYVTQALNNAQAATHNMFEALAAGALLATRASDKGEEPGDIAHTFAAIAACEGA